MRDLLASQLAFLLQFGQWLINNGEQLKNDGGRDVRHDAKSKDGKSLQLSTAEKIYKTEEAPTLLLEELLQEICIDSRCRDVAADAIDGKQPKRKQYPGPQFGHAEDVSQLLKHFTELPLPYRPPW